MIDARNRDSAGGELSREIARTATEIEGPLAACDGARGLPTASSPTVRKLNEN